MSKEATIIQSFNDVKRQYEYSVKGYDVTESVKILLKRHKEEYDKEKNIFAGIDGYLEAQKECQSQISELEAKLAGKDQAIESLEELNRSLGQNCNNDRKEIERLRELISDKEKENERLKELVMHKTYNRNAVEARLNYEQNQLAIEQLEKVKEFAIKYFDLDKSNLSLARVIDKIDNQIKQLKEMK